MTDETWTDIGALDRHPAPRRARRAERRRAASPCSAPPTTRSSRSKTAARTKAARLSQGIVHGDERHLPAAQLGHEPRDRRSAGRRRGRARSPSRSRSIEGRILIDLSALAGRPVLGRPR